jgi:hypothetical protein
MSDRDHLVDGLHSILEQLWCGSDQVAASQFFIPHDRNPTIAEIVAVARMYIAACGSPEALAINPAAAKGIGGRTLIATITPAAGFQWVEGCEPLHAGDEPTMPLSA